MDSNPAHKKAWRAFGKQHGINLSEAEWKTDVFGKSNKDILEYFFGREISNAEMTAYAEEKEEMYRSLFKETIAPVQGVLRFLGSLRQNDITIALATSAPPKNVVFVLTAIGVSKYFDIITDDSEITHGKPHPEIYQITAKKLKAEPGRCVVFEDSLSGLQSARQAGMKVVGITTTHTKEELSLADYVIDNFDDIDVEIFKQINAAPRHR